MPEGFISEGAGEESVMEGEVVFWRGEGMIGGHGLSKCGDDIEALRDGFGGAKGGGAMGGIIQLF